MNNHPVIVIDGILSAARTLFNLDLGKIIHGWNGTKYHLTHRDLIFVKNMSDFDDHLMEYCMFPDKDHLFLLLAKKK